MSSEEELAVSLWNRTDLVCKLYKLLESIVKDEFEVQKAVNQFEKSNKTLAEFIFQVSPLISIRERSKLILYNFLAFDSHLTNSLLAFIQS